MNFPATNGEPYQEFHKVFQRIKPLNEFVAEGDLGLPTAIGHNSTLPE
jgi:hypothetical protein